ncbi:hypothetical protein BC829DRAFT_414830 [Chytridium lagenaria]|nr:hypothetical protein BC829DRAFT_414830 [Chytridium lagenaria]
MAGMTQLELLWSDLSFRQSAKEDQGEPSKQLIYALLSSCVEDDAIVHQRFMEGPLGWSDSVACFPDAVRNNPAVMPIVEIIEGLLREEFFREKRRKKRSHLCRRTLKLLNERKRMLEDLTERSRELKEELLIFPLNSRSRLLGIPKSLWLCMKKTYVISASKSQIGFPLKTSKEELSSFLHQSSVTNTSDVDILSREFESLRSDFLRIIDGKPRAERKWFQALSRSCIAELEERRDYGRNRLSEMLRECRIVVREIELFWVQLDVPEEQRFPISVDVRRLEEFKTVADKLRVGWKKLMGGELIETMESMQSMWRKCHISRDEQEQTKKGFPPKFEQDASDPDRLFKASFRLLEEEKFRKASVPILLKMETTLRGLVQEFEAEKYPFFFEGRRWIQTLLSLHHHQLAEALALRHPTLPRTPLVHALKAVTVFAALLPHLILDPQAQFSNCFR